MAYLKSIYTQSNLYRGFVLTKGKQSIQKFGAGAQLSSFEDVINCQSFGGVLADDTVLIDFDSAQDAEIALNIIKTELDNVLVIKTTRGIHALFKNDGRIQQCFTHCILACGLTADIKIGLKNSYEILKLDGNLREILNPIDVKKAVSRVPAFFLPCKNLKESFTGLGEGSGRNDCLFRAISPLKIAGLSVDEIRESVKVTNRYVFAESISDEELEKTVLRDEILKASVNAIRAKVRENTAENRADVKKLRYINFYGEKAAPYIDDFGQLKVEDLAEKVIEDFNFCIIDGVVQAYHTARRCYVADVEIHKAFISTYVRNLGAQKMTSIYAHICQKVRENMNAEKTHTESRYIPFDNGVLDIDTLELCDYGAEYVFARKIPHNFKPDAYNKDGDNFLDAVTVGDKALRSLLEEMMGYCLLRDSRFRKAFILTGEKRNGKSTFLTLLRNMIGNDNVSTMDMDAFKERFSAAELYGRLANIGDDINDEFIGNTSILKKLISGEMIQAERKGRDPFRFCPYAKQIFSANDTPKMRDKTGAMLDRIVFVPFYAFFDAQSADVRIGEKLKEESCLEYMLKLAVDGLKRLLARGYFETPKPSEAENEKYKIYNSPVEEWFEEINAESDIYEKSIKDVYALYRTYAEESGLTPLSKRSVSQEVQRKFGVIAKTRRIGLITEKYFAPPAKTALFEVSTESKAVSKEEAKAEPINEIPFESAPIEETPKEKEQPKETETERFIKQQMQKMRMERFDELNADLPKTLVWYVKYMQDYEYALKNRTYSELYEGYQTYLKYHPELQSRQDYDGLTASPAQVLEALLRNFDRDLLQKALNTYGKE